jgi:hypothetical protein
MFYPISIGRLSNLKQDEVNLRCQPLQNQLCYYTFRRRLEGARGVPNKSVGLCFLHLVCYRGVFSLFSVNVGTCVGSSTDCVYVMFFLWLICPMSLSHPSHKPLFLYVLVVSIFIHACPHIYTILVPFSFPFLLDSPIVVEILTLLCHSPPCLRYNVFLC